jgi:hypothetical protein
VLSLIKYVKVELIYKLIPTLIRLWGFSRISKHINGWYCGCNIWVSDDLIKTKSLTSLNEIASGLGVELCTPTTVSGSVKKVNITTNPVFLYEWSGIFKFHGSSVLYTSDNYVFIDQDFSRCNSTISIRTESLKYNDESSSLLYCSEKAIVKDMPNKIYIDLVGDGDFNYFHALIERLSKLFFIVGNSNFNKEVSLVISHDLFSMLSIKKILDFFLHKYNFSLLVIPRKSAFYFERIYSISNFNCVVYNLKYNELVNVDDFYFRSDAIDWLSNSLISGMMSKDVFPRRIYLARKLGSSRCLNNQQDLIEVLGRHDIVPIYIEDFSIEEQIKIFHDAEIIVGATGAAWSNIIFSRGDPLCITWLPETEREFSVFSTLASSSNATLYNIDVGINKDESNLHSDYSVDVDLFKINIGRSINEYEAR